MTAHGRYWTPIFSLRPAGPLRLLLVQARLLSPATPSFGADAPVAARIATQLRERPAVATWSLRGEAVGVVLVGRRFQ